MATKQIVESVEVEEIKVAVDNVVEDVVVAPVASEEDDYGNEGFEDEERSLTSLPVLSLAQSQTPEVAEGTIEGLRAGVLMNSVTKEPLGEKMEVIIYRMWKSRAKMPPRGEGSFPECYSVDGNIGSKGQKCAECPYMGIKTESCREQKYMIVAPADEPNNLMRLIFWKSNMTAGRKASKILQAEGARHSAPLYGMTINLTTLKKKNTTSNSIYYVFETAMAKVHSTKVGPNATEAEIAKAEEAKQYIADIRPNFLEATKLRDKNVKDFYAFIATSKEGGDADPDDFAKGLDESGIEGGDGEAAKDNSTDALM